MRNIDRDLDRILTHLRRLIRERGFTQMEVQDTLGWGRSYLSQLLTQQKSLRVDQVLLILKAIDADPGAFFGEIYQLGGDRPPAEVDVGANLHRLGMLVEGLVTVLRQKGLISASDLAAAIKKVRALDSMRRRTDGSVAKVAGGGW